MDGFDSRNRRRILKTKWQDKIRTAVIREVTGQCRLVSYYRNDGSLGPNGQSTTSTTSHADSREESTSATSENDVDQNHPKRS